MTDKSIVLHCHCLTAILARAAESIGLEVNRPPSSEPSLLDDWFLGISTSDESYSVVPREGAVHHGGPGAPSLAQSGRDEKCQQGALSRCSHLPGGAVWQHHRELCPAVLGGTARTSCPGVMHRPPLLPRTGLSLPVAVGALLRPPELLSPVLNRHLGRHVEPLAGKRRPPRPSQAPSRPGC